ncbi:MAG: DUF3887 domain-containing protein [Rhodanobacteraceae bacterium]|nr:MAG: DUF3887 domain-containing protein [Rhodanobacteraceae bacterium]
MHHKLIVAVFMAACPAFASAAGQTPAASAQAHPAASAHATAAAGQTGAARIEACTQAASTLIENLEQGNAKAATAEFDATMQANLGADKLAAAWRQVGSLMGKLQGRGTPQNAMYQGHTIVTLPLQFTKGNLNAQVACDADGKVAGFYMRPATS